MAVDGGEGYAVVNPDTGTVAKFERKQKAAAAERPAYRWGSAARPSALIPKLVELSVTELSMSVPSIPRAKKLVSGL